MSKSQDYIRLQRKIFSRWVNQKLVLTRGIHVNDVVEDGVSGTMYIALLEVLSEKKCNAKINANPKQRVQQIENCNAALQFCWDCGVELKLKPQGTDLVDKNEKNILALVWAIMLKFLKFGDDTASLNAKDALLMWCQNKLASYPGVEVKSFGKEWHNGLALCAIIHKHRPKLINWESLNPSEGLKNIKTAMDAAEKYFALEQYITPEDIVKLDENSMVVYVSEYYYGIAEQRKMDLAARRIGKVIKLTKENDAMKVEYQEKSKSLRGLLDKNEKLLEDRTIDNNMAGAKKRIADFYAYKAHDKNEIIRQHLACEAVYNNLAMRLSHHKRPVFNPGQGLTLKDLSSAIEHLEQCEQERKVALHKELNRQIKLVKLDEQHATRSEKLAAWIASKEKFLTTTPDISSVSSAELQLKLLAAYEQENATVKSRSVAEAKNLSAELAKEKYENIDKVKARDTATDAGLAKLDQLLAGRKPVADDDLAREKFKEAVRLQAQQHEDKFNKLEGWIDEKEAYLSATESIGSVQQARKALSILQVFYAEAKRTNETAVAELKQLGQTILAQKYQSNYSTWTFDDPSELSDREGLIASRWEKMNSAAAQKQKTLDAALELELEKERLRLEWTQLSSEFTSWVNDNLENVLPFAQFGYTLEEVGAYEAVLNKSDAAINAEADTKKAAYEAVNSKLSELGVTEIFYTKLTTTDLEASRETLTAGLEERRALWQAELDKQKANDALCKDFANLAEPLSKFIVDKKDQITSSQKSLEEQLAFVVSCESTLEEDGKSLGSIELTWGKIEAAGITNNRHTTLTAKDVEVQFEQYTDFLEAKKKMLEQEIQNQKLKGITQEQMGEITTNFQLFDKDNSQSIDSKELKACLYSLGEEKTASEIEAIMAKHGSNGSITFEGFKEFMIGVYGDSDSKEEIVASFKLICRGDAKAKVDKLEFVCPEADVKFFTSTAPHANNEYDYVAWTDEVYAR